MKPTNINIIYHKNDAPHYSNCCYGESTGPYSEDIDLTCDCGIHEEIEAMAAIKEKMSEYKSLVHIIEESRKKIADMQCQANAVYTEITGLKNHLMNILEK